MHGQADYAELQGSEVSQTETDRDKQIPQKKYNGGVQ